MDWTNVSGRPWDVATTLKLQNGSLTLLAPEDSCGPYGARVPTPEEPAMRQEPDRSRLSRLSSKETEPPAESGADLKEVEAAVSGGFAVAYSPSNRWRGRCC